MPIFNFTKLQHEFSKSEFLHNYYLPIYRASLKTLLESHCEGSMTEAIQNSEVIEDSVLFLLSADSALLN
jgi:hypothetical protein